MRDMVGLGLLLCVAVFVYSRLQRLEEKLVLLKRCVDRQIGESDIEYVVKSVRDTTADALEVRLQRMQAQLDHQASRLNASTSERTSTDLAD